MALTHENAAGDFMRILNFWHFTGTRLCAFSLSPIYKMDGVHEWSDSFWNLVDPFDQG
jgi:hypothetical protein